MSRDDHADEPEFDNDLADIFYQVGLDDDGRTLTNTHGSVAEGEGWYGLLEGDLLEVLLEIDVEDEDGDEFPAITDLTAAEVREVATAKGAILSESRQGRVGITFYDNAEDLAAAWKKIEGGDTDSEDAGAAGEEE